MREAKCYGYGRDAALPQTYYWFIRRCVVRVRGTISNLTLAGRRSVTSTSALAVFVWLNYHPDPRAGDTLQSVRQVAPGAWLYTTLNSEGGAKVPTVYRYYLRSADGANVQQLNADFPFLTGGGTKSAIAVDGDAVRVDYSGKVYSIEQHAGRYFMTYSLR